METKNLLNKKITQCLLLVAMLIGCGANAWASNEYNSRYIYIDCTEAPDPYKSSLRLAYYWKASCDEGDGSGSTDTFSSAATNIFYYDLKNFSDSYSYLRSFKTAQGSGWWNQACLTPSSSGHKNNCIKITNYETQSWSTYVLTPSSISLSVSSGSMGGDGTTDNPYVVKASSSFTLSASNLSFDPSDPNMSGYYYFGTSSTGTPNQSSSSKTVTASSTKGDKTRYYVIVKGTYNGAYSSGTASNSVYVKTFEKYYIKHNWSEGGWSWKEMTDNGDGTWSYVGKYKSGGCNYNFVDDDDKGSKKWISAPTLVGEPSEGDECTFTLDPSKGEDSDAITITKNCATPTKVAVTINSSTSATICSGNTATISTASSQSGYKYQLINSSSAVVSTVDGKSDGSAVSFSVGTADNAYKVHAYLDGDEGCAADMSNTVKLSVDQPTVAGTITGAGDICSGDTKVLSSNGATATNYKWKSCSTESGTYVDASGTINLSTYSAKPEESTYYKLAVKNGACEWAYTDPVRVVVNNKPAQPGEITEGTPAPCINATGLTYSITAVATATGYTWTLPDGWSITSGAGTLSITATAGTAGGDIKVTADNDCGPSAVQTLPVTVKGKAITVSPTMVSAKKYTPTALTATTEGETVTWAVTGTDNYLLKADKSVYTNENVKQVTVKAVSSGNVTATTTNDGCETSATVTLSPTADTETCN